MITWDAHRKRESDYVFRLSDVLTFSIDLGVALLSISSREDVATLRTVAGLLGTRVRRAPETGRSALALAEIRPRPESPIAAR